MSTAAGAAGWTGPDVEALQAACDELVRTAADPTVVRALVVRLWALGASSTDELVSGLCAAAETAAERTGTPPDAADLLALVGRPVDSVRLRDAVERGLDAHDRAAHEAARARRAVLAARAAVRIAGTAQHRRATARAA